MGSLRFGLTIYATIEEEAGFLRFRDTHMTPRHLVDQNDIVSDLHEKKNVTVLDSVRNKNSGELSLSTQLQIH